MPCRRQWSRIACCSARVAVQPVGLLGELTSAIRVPGVSAASRRSRSRRHRPAPNASGTHSTVPDRIFGISTRLGHSGVTATTRSPGATSASTTSISADMPDAVTATLAAAVGRCSAETYAAMASRSGGMPKFCA